MNVSVRPHDPRTKGEAAALYAIFVEAVRVGAKDHYSQAQRRVWAPHDQMPDGWPDRIARLETWVGEANGEIAGFMAADEDGYVDLAFVRPRWMGRGVAQALHGRVVERARKRGLTRLTTHASHLARRFFVRRGWQVDYPETVERDGEVLERFAMFLNLEDQHEKTDQPRR